MNDWEGREGGRTRGLILFSHDLNRLISSVMISGNLASITSLSLSLSSPLNGPSIKTAEKNEAVITIQV